MPTPKHCPHCYHAGASTGYRLGLQARDVAADPRTPPRVPLAGADTTHAEFRALQSEVCGDFNPNVAYGVKERA